MCPTPVTHLVVKFPTPGKVKRSNPPWSPGGGGGGLQLIGALDIWLGKDMYWMKPIPGRDVSDGTAKVYGKALAPSQ